MLLSIQPTKRGIAIHHLTFPNQPLSQRMKLSHNQVSSGSIIITRSRAVINTRLSRISPEFQICQPPIPTGRASGPFGMWPTWIWLESHIAGRLLSSGPWCNVWNRHNTMQMNELAEFHIDWSLMWCLGLLVSFGFGFMWWKWECS